MVRNLLASLNLLEMSRWLGAEVEVDEVAAGVVEGGEDHFTRPRQDHGARFNPSHHRGTPKMGLH